MVKVWAETYSPDQCELLRRQHPIMSVKAISRNYAFDKPIIDP